MVEGRELIERYIEAVNRRDPAALRIVLDPDYVDEMPQSGERIRGRENYIAMLVNYPGAEGGPDWADPASVRVFGGENRWLLSPAFNVISVQGGGDTFVVIFRFPFQDGTVWHAARILTTRDGRVLASTSIYGQKFAAPSWRAQWVEQM